MNKPLDFVAIGDITTDAFIRLKDAHVNCNINKDSCEICMAFGDKVPYEFVEIVKSVGNSPNASVSAHRLGLSSGLISNLGDDQNGGECLATLTKQGVDTTYVKVHKNRETNYHYVLWFEDERTILVKHHDYDYKFPDLPAPKWLYLSSLGESSLAYHGEIETYLKANPETRLAFQPGTFQMKLGVEKLKGLYAHTEVFFCNVEEAKRILKAKDDTPVEKLLEDMRVLGPRIAVITDGPRGAYVYDGRHRWFMPPYPDPKPPYERTGAGDAFASTFTSALALGKDIAEALMWGPINSMSVVQYVGAQKGLLSREQLEKHLADAPKSYKPKLLM